MMKGYDWTEMEKKIWGPNSVKLVFQASHREFW